MMLAKGTNNDKAQVLYEILAPYPEDTEIGWDDDDFNVCFEVIMKMAVVFPL